MGQRGWGGAERRSPQSQADDCEHCHAKARGQGIQELLPEPVRVKSRQMGTREGDLGTCKGDRNLPLY